MGKSCLFNQRGQKRAYLGRVRLKLRHLIRFLHPVANFVSEIGIAVHLYPDLAKGFLMGGHGTDAITSYPREFNLISPDTERESLCDEVMEGAVHRCGHLKMRDNLVVRGLEHFCPVQICV